MSCIKRALLEERMKADEEYNGYVKSDDYKHEEKHSCMCHDKAYKAYIAVHGAHFCEALAEDVICKLENADGSTHKWSVKQVVAACMTFNPNMKFLHNVTHADLAYAANMYYADFYPESISDESKCIKAAMMIANDPDGYEGQIFCRWVADVKAKGHHIDWHKYIK